MDVSKGVQPACRMLGAGFVELRQRGSLCRRKMRRWDTLLPWRAQVIEGKAALTRVFEFGLREETCGCDGWRAQGQTDSVGVGTNGNGLGQCGDDLHLAATRRAFRHTSTALRTDIDAENPCKQAGPGEAIDRLG